MRLRRALAAGTAALVLVGACGDDDGGDAAPQGSGGGSGGGAVLTVETLEPLATSLAESYNADDPDQPILVKVAPQPQVVKSAQASGAIAPNNWLKAAKAKSKVIGRTLAIIVVPAGNPAQVTGVDVFAAGSGANVRACGPDSPFGNFAELAVRIGGAQPDPAVVAAGCEQEAVDQVARGDLDAALVFRNAVTLPDGVETVDVPAEKNIVIQIGYAGPAEFGKWLASDAAKEILTDEGYLP